MRGMTREDILAQSDDQRQCGRRQARGAAARAAATSRSARGWPRTSARSVGSSITIINPAGPLDAVRHRAADRRLSRSRAIFEVGVYDYDKAFVVMPMRGCADSAAARRHGRDDRGQDHRCRPGRRDPRAARRASSQGQAVVNDWRLDQRGVVRGAGGRAGGDVLRPVAHHPGRGVQHPLLADHAGPRQDARHRDPAHDGRDARAAC